MDILRCRRGEILVTTCLNRIDFSIFPVIELDDGKNLTGKPDQFDGKNPWVSGEDFPQQTNPMIRGLLQIVFVQNQTKSPVDAILKTHKMTRDLNTQMTQRPSRKV